MNEIDFIILKSGDVISFFAGFLNNTTPWYRIVQQSQYSDYCYYDGPDLEEAKDLFYSLILAFKGLKPAESFLKKDFNIKNDYNPTNTTDQQLKFKNSFLGMNDF